MTTIHISQGGPTRVLQVNGKRFHFEMHPYCGPILIGKRGDPLANQMNNHPFWTAVSHWAQQGQRLDAEGLCVWDHPAEEIPRGKQVGRHLFVTHFETIPARKGD